VLTLSLPRVYANAGDPNRSRRACLVPPVLSSSPPPGHPTHTLTATPPIVSHIRTLRGAAREWHVSEAVVS